MRLLHVLAVAMSLCVVTHALAQQGGTLTLYSGRSKTLVEPLIQQFEEASGVDVQVRFGPDAQHIATLQEEGAASPADVFWANTAGALAAASNAGLLTKLPQDVLDKPAAFVPSSGLWTPVTTRFRVLAFNTRAVKESDLPESVLDLPKLTQLKGRIGWTPTYSSFQDFITAMRIEHGDAKAKEWLRAMQALEPKAYPSNPPMIEALAAGEVDVVLTNHYYIIRWRAAHEAQKDTVQAYHFAPDDVGNLALVTGAGVLRRGGQNPAAMRFVEFLLSKQAQEFAAERGHEYPVVPGATLPDRLMPLDAALKLGPDLDLERLRELEGTLTLLREVGLQ